MSTCQINSQILLEDEEKCPDGVQDSMIRSNNKFNHGNYIMETSLKKSHLTCKRNFMEKMCEVGEQAFITFDVYTI